MPRPTILVADPGEGRRKEISRGLAEYGYEVVAAHDSAEATRFAVGLNPSMIVAAADLEHFGDGKILEQLTQTEGQEPPTLIVLTEEEKALDEEAPAGLMTLVVTGLAPAGILRKLHTALVGQELKMQADSRFESLLADLQVLPLFDLLPELKRTVISGRLIMEEGEIAFNEGDAIAARAGKVRGVKAFCRIARTASGSFRLLVGPAGMEREIKQDLLTLMAAAIEDQHRWDEAREKLADLASRAHVEMGPSFFQTHFSPDQQLLLGSLQKSVKVWSLLDAVPSPDGQVLEELSRLYQMGFVVFEEPEFAVRVVTDSTSDLPQDIALRHGVHVVPLSVLFGEDVLRDGIDITPGAFYRMLQTRKDVHPRTSPPTKGSFLVDYQSLLKRYDIVSVHISEKMSLTSANAGEAAKELESRMGELRTDGTVPVLEVLNSTQVSTGLGLMVLFAARMAQRGVTAPEIRGRLEAMRDRFHLLFVVDTLDYLVRGGRIGKARGLLGGLLGIKPILGVVDGEVTAIDKVRGGKAAHPKVIELIKARVDAGKPIVAGIGHASAPIWADRLRNLLAQSFTITEFLLNEIGPVVGTHTGPGCVGVVVFQPTDEEAELIAPLPISE